MFRSYFGIEENPFSNTPDPRYLFMSKRHQEALAHLIYGIKGVGGFFLLTGEVGTGKTTICRCLVERLPKTVNVALFVNPRLSEAELLASICDEMRIAYSGPATSIKTLMDSINGFLLDQHARGFSNVLIIDEAQNLSPPVLELVRLLTNLETTKAKLLQIILIGQPELLDILARREMRQLAQRITARYHLAPLTGYEAKSYIRHRISVGGLSRNVFQASAIAEISTLSKGIPRQINSICDRCLLAAYALEKTSIDRKLARSAAAEVLGGTASAGWRRSALLPVAAVAVAAAAAFVIYDPFDTGFLAKLTHSRTAASLRDTFRSWPFAAASPDRAGTEPGTEAATAAGKGKNKDQGVAAGLPTTAFPRKGILGSSGGEASEATVLDSPEAGDPSVPLSPAKP